MTFGINPVTGKQLRGLALASPEKRREIAIAGGKKGKRKKKGKKK